MHNVCIGDRSINYARRKGPRLTSADTLRKKKAYYEANKTRILAKMRENRDRDKEHAFKVRKAYGLSVGEYQHRLQEQNGRCAICQRPAELFKRRLAVDHNHRTGRVRGLLCSDCNRMLGLAKDSTDILYNAYCYMLVDEHVTITAALGTGASTMPDERDLD